MIKTIEAITHDFQGDLFIDIGGNVGMWTTQLVDLYENVFFVEPSELAMADAKRKIQDVCTQKAVDMSKVKFFKNICSDKAGDKNSIYATTSDTGNFSVFAKDLYGADNVTMKEDEIETINIDSLIPLVPEDSKNILIKIDTEGCDLDILSGGFDFIRKFKPTVIVEAHYHMYFDEEKHSKVFDFLLNEMGYDLEEFKFPGYSSRPDFLFDGKHNGNQMFDMHFQMILRPDAE